MDALLSEDQIMIRGMVRDFCRDEVAPLAAETDAGRFPAGLVERMAGLGLLGMTVPAEWGGSGVDEVAAALAMEEVSAVCPSLSVVFSVQNALVCPPILAFGSAEQKQAFLKPLASGEKLGCFALTEPGAGSDVSALKTSAKRGGDHWRIDGAKRFISNGREADLCLLFAMTDPSARHRGISAFIAETASPGFEAGRAEEKLGLGGSSVCDLRFEGLEVPEGNLLGEEGQGFEIAMKTLDASRIGVAAQGVGFARACLEASIGYARERETFGVPISEHQPIQWKVADMATGVEAARLLYLKAARMKEAGLPFSAEAAMAKVFASDLAQRAGAEAVQIHGGSGYMREYPVEKFYRAAKATQIYEGTNEILRDVIAKNLID
jgi:alkylation response protein AidB-like acyl-CoA dehydrogenase